MGLPLFAERYRAIRRLAYGGTATVYLARDERLERDVAIKRVHGAEVTATTAKRLWREARITASLRHPNLVAIYDIVIDGEDLLLVMEYVEGQTLADVLASAPLSWEHTAELLDPVASALDYVHSQGVVHRDLKPSNVLVGDDGSVKVADLGLATAAEITKITPPGAIMGTPAYMAPEQARPGTPTPAADVFALATIAFEALSGTLPRWGQTVVAILAQATREPPADLREHRPNTPASVARALVRGMSPDPEERQPSASLLLADLEAAFAADPTVELQAASRPARTRFERELRSRPAGNRRTRILAFGALGLAVLAIVAVWATWPRAPSSRSSSRVARVAPTRAAHPASSGAPSTSSPPVVPATATRTAHPASSRAPSTSSPPVVRATTTRTPRPAPSPSPTASPTPAVPALSATQTVRAFYRHAAAGRYARAWSMAGPRMRQAFGNSLQRFSRELASLQQIRFERVAIVARDEAGATVDIRTVATHVDRVDRCSGTLRAIRRPGGGWLVEPAGVRCTSS